jgi:hypothetical protein
MVRVHSGLPFLLLFFLWLRSPLALLSAVAKLILLQIYCKSIPANARVKLAEPPIYRSRLCRRRLSDQHGHVRGPGDTRLQVLLKIAQNFLNY